jgi:hypothetical protein
MQAKLDQKDLKLNQMTARQHELQEKLATASEQSSSYSPKKDLNPRKRESRERIPFPSPPSSVESIYSALLPVASPPSPTKPSFSPYTPIKTHSPLILGTPGNPRRNYQRSASQPNISKPTGFSQPYISKPIAFPLVESKEAMEFGSFIDASLSNSSNRIPVNNRYSTIASSNIDSSKRPSRPVEAAKKKGGRRSEGRRKVIDSDASSSGTSDSSGSDSDEEETVVSASLPKESMMMQKGVNMRPGSSTSSGSSTMNNTDARRNSVPTLGGKFTFGMGGKKEVSFDKKLKSWFKDSRLNEE